MIDNLCPKHGLPMKNRKDKKGKFCPLCVDAKARGNGNQKFNKS